MITLFTASQALGSAAATAAAAAAHAPSLAVACRAISCKAPLTAATAAAPPAPVPRAAWTYRPPCQVALAPWLPAGAAPGSVPAARPRLWPAAARQPSRGAPRSFASAPVAIQDQDGAASQEGAAAAGSVDAAAAKAGNDEVYIAPHAGTAVARRNAAAAGPAAAPADSRYVLTNPVYTPEYVAQVAPRHLPPARLHQRAALATIRVLRAAFDRATGYGAGRTMTEHKWLTRMLFLETVAGVPGMVGGVLRHLKSLRLMRADQGWINTLLAEAENERMHLLTFMELRRPGPLFRAAVIGAQGVFLAAYTLAYALSPRYCHALVGYLEEEAVRTYTHALECIDNGTLWRDTPAPAIAVAYWALAPAATMRDVILAVRADEACHAHVNHTYGAMAQDAASPFRHDSHVIS